MGKFARPLVGSLLVIVVMAGCARPPRSTDPSTGPEARRVADAFVRHALAGDVQGACPLVIDIDACDDWNLRGFARNNVEENIRVAGATEVNGNSFTYPLRGQYPKQFGEGTIRFRATLRVWVIFSPDGWLVSDWIYQKR